MKTCALLRFRIALAGTLLAGLLLVAGCAKKGPDPDDVPVAPAGGESRVAVERGGPVVKLKPQEIEGMGLKTAVLNKTMHRAMRAAFGVVLDPQALATSAAALAEAQAQMTMAGSALAASGAERDRARRLHEDQENLSTKEFEAADAAWRSDQAAAGAAQAALQSVKTTVRQQWGPVLADWLGQGGVDYRRIESGEDALLRVALPGDAPVRSPASATVSLPDGQRVKAAFVSTANQANPEFQSADFFFVVKGHPGLLPGMNLDVLVPAGGPDTSDVDLPAAAVLHWQGRTWVYLQAEPGTFSRREIPSDASDGEGGYLATDFPPGAAVVVQGAAALLSEEFKPASGDTD